MSEYKTASTKMKANRADVELRSPNCINVKTRLNFFPVVNTKKNSDKLTHFSEEIKM